MEDDFWLGVNYWPADKAMYWWKAFDEREVEKDFGKIADLGLSLVRICLMWEDFQPEPDGVETSQVDNLAAVLDIAQRHGLRVIPTLLVGNMSGIMWFPHWAFTDEPETGQALQISGGAYVRRQLRSPFDDPFMLRAEARLAEAVAAFLGTMRPQFMASEDDAAAYYSAVLDRLWQTGALGALA